MCVVVHICVVVVVGMSCCASVGLFLCTYEWLCA